MHVLTADSTWILALQHTIDRSTAINTLGLLIVDQLVPSGMSELDPWVCSTPEQ